MLEMHIVHPIQEVHSGNCPRDFCTPTCLHIDITMCLSNYMYTVCIIQTSHGDKAYCSLLCLPSQTGLCHTASQTELCHTVFKVDREEGLLLAYHLPDSPTITHQTCKNGMTSMAPGRCHRDNTKVFCTQGTAADCARSNNCLYSTGNLGNPGISVCISIHECVLQIQVHTGSFLCQGTYIPSTAQNTHPHLNASQCGVCHQPARTHRMHGYC